MKKTIEEGKFGWTIREETLMDGSKVYDVCGNDGVSIACVDKERAYKLLPALEECAV